MFDWIVNTTWESMGRTLGSGVLIYLVVVLAVRVNGLRTFAKMSGYDFAATVSIGSVIASVTITQEVPVIEGVAAVVAIVGAQRALTELRRRTTLDRVVDNPPVLVMANGSVLAEGMSTTGLNESDLHSKLRAAGVASLDDITAVVFEPTGELSVSTHPIGDLDPRLFAGVAGADALGLPEA